MTLDIRLVSDSELGSFSWRWPEKTEHFERGYAALVRFEGGEFRIRHGISRRTVYGRPRLHSVTWVENRPTVEGVEADDFAHSRSLLSLIKVTKRHLRPTDPLPPKYRVVCGRGRNPTFSPPRVTVLRLRMRGPSGPAPAAGSDHRLWETAVLFHLRDAFRAGDVWLARSRRYGDIRKALLSAPAVADADHSLPAPASPHDWLAERRFALDKGLRRLAAAARAGAVAGGSIMMKLPTGIVGNIGLYYACYRLSALGWNVMPTARNTRGIDVVCFSVDGKTVRTIQVKSLTKADTVPLGTDLEKIMGDFWVIVNSLGTNHPRAYILLPHEVQALAVRNRSGKRAYWLPLKQYAVDAFEEQWQRIGQPRPAPPASST